MSLFDVALRNFFRRRLRAILTVCGVAAGIAAFVALVGFSRSFENQWMRVYEDSGTDLVVIQRTFLNTSIDESNVNTIRALPEVERAVPVILNMMDITPDTNALVYGWRADSFDMDSLTIVQGRRYVEGAPEVMLGELLAETLGKSAGDVLEIQGAPFKVAGVFRGGSALETGAMLMPIRQLQNLADLGDKVTAFHVRLRPQKAGETAEQHLAKSREAIERVLPGLKAVPANDLAANNQLVVLARSSAWGTSLIALFISAIGIANTMAMSVLERTKEIGVLRALGWRRWRIMRLILGESAILGLCGGVLGLVAGIAALRILAALPATAHIIPSAIPLTEGMAAIVISVFIGIAAGFAPAWRGARLSPVEALRHE